LGECHARTPTVIFAGQVALGWLFTLPAAALVPVGTVIVAFVLIGCAGGISAA